MNQRLFLFVVLLAAFAGAGCDSKPESLEQASDPIDSGAKQVAPAVGDASLTDLKVSEVDRQSDYVDFPSIGVRIVRPENFGDAEDFHGFIQNDTQSSVMTLKIPGPFSEISSGFNGEAMKLRGMNLKSREEIEISGLAGILLNFTQEAYGIEFSKWMIVFGNEEETTLVTATFPSSKEDELSDELKASVLSTRTDGVSLSSSSGDVAWFTIEQSPKLGATKDIGKLRMFTKDDTVSPKSPEEPVFLVAPSVAPAPIKDRAQFAHQRLMQTALTKISSVISNKEITIDKLEGYEMIAEAQDADTNVPVLLYQIILYKDDGSYILMQGLVGEKLREDYLPEFRAMALSFRRR